jgi:class 3 adenylate cyclase/ABC-type transport system substrate-binding protein
MSSQLPDMPPDALLPSSMPTGTVTFLFTDIEGSTKLLQRLGERYAEALADHQRLLRQAWADHAGVEVDTQGDSFFVAFARATDALAAAAEAQRALVEHTWPAGERVRVRMGLHTGEGTLAHDHSHYVGLDVHRAARIAAAGHGGQVLLSQATRDQVAKELLAGAGLRDLGRHRLKDLPRREEIYQLVLPGLPAEYPPLKTLDAWPGYRADLVSVILISVGLLAVGGLLLPFLVSAFPSWIGLGAAGLAALLVVSSAVTRPVRRALAGQWRDARKPFASVTSMLLCLVVVVTTLFVTKPPVIIKPLPNPFTYIYHAPTHTGGTVTVGAWCPFQTLAPSGLGAAFNCFGSDVYLWQSCVVQLPDLTLSHLTGWKPNQCSAVPTVANGGEDPLARWTIFHIDPRAVWSDGTPITAADFLFSQHLYADHHLCDCAPFTLMRLSAPAPDSKTVQIQWSAPYADYLTALANMPPLPLHVYATGAFAGVYDPRTGAYNSALAQQLVKSAEFNTAIPVDNGPFTIQSLPLTPHNLAGAGPAILARNARFFSNFFHRPALDRVILVSPFSDFPANQPFPKKRQLFDDLIAQYRQGKLTLVQTLTPFELSQLAGIPKAEVLTTPSDQFIEYGFNQRAVAPNAQANDGLSMFADRMVRQAFEEAFDRCAAVQALLHVASCDNPSLFSDELTVPPAPDYDPTFKLPAYNPTDAAALLDREGYLVVDGVRRGRDGKTPLVLKLILSFSALDSAELADRMQQDYARNLHVGVTVVTPDHDPFGSYEQGAEAPTGAFDLLLFGSFGYGPDPVGTFAGNDAADIPSGQNPTGGNYFGIVDSHLGQQDQIGAQVFDADQRAGVYQALQRYFAQQLDYVPMYILADIALKQPTLCNYKPSLLNDAWNSADWYMATSSCST